MSSDQQSRPPLCGRHRRRHRHGRRNDAVDPGRARLPRRLVAPVRVGALGGPAPAVEGSARSSSRMPRPRTTPVSISSSSRPGGATSREAGADRRRGRRHRHRQFVGLARRPEGSAGGGRGQSACASRHSQGHRRQSQLHDDGGHAGAQAAAQGGRPAAPGGQHLPGRFGRRHGRRRRAGEPDAARGSRRLGAGA